MKDQVDAVIEKMMCKRLQHLKPDEQLLNAIQLMDGFNSPSLNTTQCVKPFIIGLMHNINDGKRKPQFEPPYDSPLEETFAWNIVKYLDETVKLQKQVTVDTLCGRFRLDFIVQRAGRCIGLECDGEDYHSIQKDEWRDALILDTGIVQAIYRFRGKDLFTNIEDCLFLLSVLEPQIFLGRGFVCLKVLASEEAKTMICREQLDKHDHIFCAYKKYGYKYGINIHQHSYIPVNNGSSYLMEKSAFAKQHGGGDLNHLIEKFNIERYANW